MNLAYTKISLYIAPRRPLEDVIYQLKHERQEAEHIKDEDTRQKVTYTLTHLIAYLLGGKETPPNGVIIFADNERCTVKIPDKPLTINAYRCDNHFHHYDY